MATVTSDFRGSVAVITFANPPVNGLSHEVRSGLASAVARAVEAESVRAIVLAGSRGSFSAGADIREFGTPAQSGEPTLPRLIALIENCPKPVVAAIEGVCLGGGLELALGAHYRVARADARLGLPEVKLGLIPGAGGTQRLPRLVGGATALEMITSGVPDRASRLGSSGLLDQVVEGDPVDAAVRFLEASPVTPRPTRDRSLPPSDLSRLCEETRVRTRARPPVLPAPLAAVDAIEAAAGPFAAGLALERELFARLMRSPESLALRYAFRAERAAGRVDGVNGSTPVRTVEQVAVIGGGTMGAGITVSFLDAGLPVLLLEADQAALDRGRSRIAALYEGQIRKGRLQPDERDRRLSLLRPTLSYQALSEADLAIEAVFESMEVKRQVFGALDQVMKPGAILATNTSSLDLDLLAAGTSRPADVVGIHFFSPANVMRLVEVVRGKVTDRSVLATVFRLAKRLGKVAVLSGVCDGFIGNRMLDSYTRQAWYLVEEGASPSQIDQAMERFGMAMGPFRVGDLVGLDVQWSIRERRLAERPGYRRSQLPGKVVGLGRLGQKTGGGWYDYGQGDRRPTASPIVEDLVARHRRELGLTARAVSETEIVDRLVYALVNEGARLLEEGIAVRASDIDVVYVTGFGFPAWRGGPMYHADRIGAGEVCRRIREFGTNPHGDPAFWEVAPKLQGLADEGGTLVAEN